MISGISELILNKPAGVSFFHDILKSLLRRIHLLVFAAALCLLVGCEHYADASGGSPNACLVDAAVKQAVYKEYCHLRPWYWSRIMMVHWSGNRSPDTHAVCMYVLSNRLWVYDYWSGSRAVPMSYRNSPSSVATFLYGGMVAKAWYLEDEKSPSSRVGAPMRHPHSNKAAKATKPASETPFQSGADLAATP